MFPTNSYLFSGVLQSLAGRELRSLLGRDLDRLAGRGIAAFARSALNDAEGTEADERNLFALLEGFFHGFRESIESAFRVGLGNAGLVSDGSNEFNLIHG